MLKDPECADSWSAGETRDAVLTNLGSVRTHKSRDLSGVVGEYSSDVRCRVRLWRAFETVSIARALRLAHFASRNAALHPCFRVSSAE